MHYVNHKLYMEKEFRSQMHKQIEVNKPASIEQAKVKRGEMELVGKTD